MGIPYTLVLTTSRGYLDQAELVSQPVNNPQIWPRQ